VKDAPGTNTFCTDKVFIYEVAHSSGVQKCLDEMYFAGVGDADLYREDNGCSTSIKGISGESFG